MKYPSSWKRRICIGCVAAIAMLIALYMGLYQWGLIDTVWDPVFHDQTMRVLNSELSHTIRRWIYLPDAILGAIAYLGDVIFAFVGSSRRWQDSPWLVILFGLNVIPVGIVSAILVFMQGTIVGSWCFLCFVTATISLILIFLAYDEVSSCILFLHRVWKKTKSTILLWRTFWGRI